MRSPPPPAATPATARTSSPRPNASAGYRIEILSGPREAKLSALGVVSGVHKPDGIVGDLGGGSLELIDVHGSRVRGGVTLPLGSLALQDLSHKSLKRAERIVKAELFGRRPAQGRPRPHLLRGRRNMARAGAHPHHSKRIPAGGDARLFDTGTGRARFRAATAPSGIGEHAGQHRSRRRCAAAVARLCRARSRIHHSRGKAEDHRIFDLRGARRPSLRNAAGGRALQGRI